MSILYTAVVRGKVVIASYGEQNREKDVLRLLPPSSPKLEQKIFGNLIYTFASTPSLVFVCASPQSSNKQVPMNYVDTLSRRWAATLGSQSQNSPPHGLDQAFVENFGSLINEYNKPSDKVSEINAQINETKNLMDGIISKATDRGAELESLDMKSNQLLDTSEEFRTQATNLAWRMRCQWLKTWAIWIVIFLVIIFFILKFICGGWDLRPRCRAPQSDTA